MGSAGAGAVQGSEEVAVNIVDYTSYEAESFSKYLEVIKSRHGSAPLRFGARPLEAEKPLTRSAGVSFTEAPVKSRRYARRSSVPTSTAPASRPSRASPRTLEIGKNADRKRSASAESLIAVSQEECCLE